MTLRRRGSILPTTLFVLLCIHALVTVILASLRNDTALIQGSDRRQEALLAAQSAVEVALDNIGAPSGATWETSNIFTIPPATRPPVGATSITVASGQQAQVWIEPDPTDPDLRSVWAASQDGRKWQFARVAAVRREVHPGILYGVQNDGGANKVFSADANGSTAWLPSSSPTTLDWATGLPRATPPTNPIFVAADADKEGRIFLLQSEDGPTGTAEHHVLVIDSTQPSAGPLGTFGVWGIMPDFPPGFLVDFAGLAINETDVYAIGGDATQRSILKASLSDSIKYGPGALAGAWSVVCNLPTTVWVKGVGFVTLPYTTTSLEAQDDGTLIAHMTFPDPDPSLPARSAFACYKAGAWSFFRPPSQVTAAEVLGGFRPLQLDDLGSPLTYAAEAGNPSARGFYRFVSSETVSGSLLDGQWKELPGISIDDPPLGAIRSASVDSEGRLFMGVRAGTEPNPTSFSQVKVYPLRSSEHAQTQTRALPVGAPYLTFIRGGGRPSTGQLEYVPVNWY